jgi:DNA-directed RNA polymerase specialized sigma24 family protein
MRGQRWRDRGKEWVALEKTQNPAPAAGRRIARLTHRNLDGVVYQRDPAVEEQIAEALSLGPEQLRARAEISEASEDGYLKEECLVCLLRHYHANVDRELVNGLAEMLLHRCSGWIKSRLSSLQPKRADDGYAEVIERLFDPILDLTSDRGDFLQVRFWVVLDKLVTRAFGRQIKQHRQEQQSVRLESLHGYDGDGDDRDGQGEPSGAETQISVPSFETTVVQNDLIRDALIQIENPDHRLAFLLRHHLGWPIEDQNPTVPTISRHFRKEPRTIRYWLAKVEESLSKWRGEQS